VCRKVLPRFRRRGNNEACCGEKNKGRDRLWNKNEQNGKIDQASGKVKQAVAALTNDDDLKAEGQADETAGKVESAVGQAQKKVGAAIERVGAAVKR
jgi:uncharacterized protein YjbJ (UPF0337 family)